jgi:hypothetical protein
MVCLQDQITKTAAKNCLFIMHEDIACLLELVRVYESALNDIKSGTVFFDNTSRTVIACHVAVGPSPHSRSKDQGGVVSTPGSRPKGRGPLKVPTKKTDTDHVWIDYKALNKTVQVCKICAVVRHADDKNPPCKGIVNVRPR